jgi:formylglycine-generating enzyme required for sulfatase activity
MAWVVIEKFQQWSARRQELLAGLVSIAVEGAASSVPVVGTVAGKILGELARYGVKRLLEPQAEIPDVKKAGQPFPAEQLDQINAWLEVLTTSYAGLLDRLEPLLTASNQTAEQLRVLVERALLERAELVQEFDACAKEVRRATLSLAVIEDKLDRNFHEIHRVALAQEEIKAILIDSPLLADYVRFRHAQPDALDAVVQADAHFLAGRRDEGIAVLLGLLQRRGVGGETICHKLGLAYLGAGKVAEAARVLDQAVPAAGGGPPALLVTRTHLSTAAGRGSDLPVWRSLPRGFKVGRKYRIEAEVGRGGMASVYRAVGVDLVNEGQAVAVKVPAPGLMRDEHARQRFLQEIRVSQRLSAARRPEIVQTLGYELFDDPHTGGEMYGLVLEYIDGWSLAHVLTERQTRQRPLSVREVMAVLRPVCRALDFAHGQNPRVLHRDVKPANIVVGRAGKPIKLTDFGIARVLEDCRQTWTGRGEPVGTPAYMPPEFWDPQAEADPRSDVYQAGNLLLELLTFHPRGVLRKRRPDCPKAWADLIHEAMSPDPERRPASMREFLGRLEEGHGEIRPSAKAAELPKEIVNSIGMKLVLVPRGTFWVGDRGSQRRAEIPDDFYIGVYPVTQEQWQAVMGNNPSWFSRKGAGADEVKGFPDADLKQFPVEQVSWDDVQEFLKRLNARENDSRLLYRLPTETEWEYACRGGATSQEDCAFDFYFGQPTNDLSSEQANFDGKDPAGSAPKGKCLERTTKVGSYQPNRLGLYDMHGNVWEWCEDEFEAQGSAPMVRGGGWRDYGSICRASGRRWFEPGFRSRGLGFRLAAVPAGE